MDTPHASTLDLTARIKAAAGALGFDPVGVTTAEPFTDTQAVVLRRLKEGLLDGLPWFHEQRVRRGCDPQALLAGARSIISLALPYQTGEPDGPDDALPQGSPPSQEKRPRGRISRYAWAADYHKVIEGRTKTFAAEINALGGRAKSYVDYGPMPDRAVAARAGVGWFGKNTNLLTSTQGSWVFLAEVITDLDLVPDKPLKKSCGKCVACMPACPTGAIVAPYVIDNTRCISYHTIENRGAIPRDFRPLMGDWVFGCDICQDVCPVNDHLAPQASHIGGHPAHPGAHAAPRGDPAFAAQDPERSRPDLIGLLTMTEADFEIRFRGSPVRRTTWPGLVRNACIALGNSGSPEAVPPLVQALGHQAPLVRSHAAWALGRLGGEPALHALREALRAERDAGVLDEVRIALL